jgi:hypothetical protein
MQTDEIELMGHFMGRRESQCLADIIQKYRHEFPLERNIVITHGDGFWAKCGEPYYLNYGWKPYIKTISISKEEFDNLTIMDYCSPTKDFPYHVAIGGYSTMTVPDDTVQLTLHLS